jgi:predicted amidohydrolase YtcJ
MLKRGNVMTGGSDAPCTLPDPLAGIAAACTHYVGGESLSFTEALALFTRNAAYGCFDEADRGTLEPGKSADMTVLSENPLALAPEELGRLRPDDLYLSGALYERGQGLGELLLRGLTTGRRRKI